MKDVKKYLCIIACLTFLTLNMQCPITGEGSLEIRVQDGTISNIANYEISLIGPGSSITETHSSENKEFTFDGLEAGAWGITVRALNNENAIVGMGESIVEIEVDKSIIAQIELTDPRFSIFVGVNPSNSGTITLTPDKKKYTKGETVTISANPAECYLFDRWSGTFSEKPYEFEMTVSDDITIIALFNQPIYQIITSVYPENGGTIAKNPAKDYYTCGEAVILTVVPASADYVFTGWSGSLSGTEMTKSMKVIQDLHVTAGFVYAPRFTLDAHHFTCYNLTENVILSPPPDTDGKYQVGKQVIVSLHYPNFWCGMQSGEHGCDYIFSRWIDAAGYTVSTNSSFTITMDENKFIRPEFTTANCH